MPKDRRLERYREERGCKSKKRHPSWRSAEKHARHLTREGDAGLMIYRCRYCGGYHVGHREKP